MAELKGKIRIDTAEAINSLKGVASEGDKAFKQIQDAFAKKLQVPDTANAAKAFDGVRASLSASITEQKSALASLIATGQSSSKAFADTKEQLLASAREARKLDDALAEVTSEIDKVNGTKITIGDQLKASLSGGALVGGIIGGGVAGAVQSAISTITGALSDAIQIGSQFETGMKSLSAVTGATGPLLDKLGGSARGLAVQFGGSANEQLGVFQTTLSKIGPQLAQSPEALAKFAENVNLLGKTDAALGAAGGVDALTSSLLQFGVNVNDSNAVASESSRFMNVLAASAAVGSASVSDVAAAIGVVGGTAHNANQTFEETNAALQVLASKSIVGSQAGTAYTAVLNKLQGATGPAADKLKTMGTSVQELGELLTTQGIGAAIGKLRGAMDTLGSTAEKNAFLTQFFGETGLNAASALLDGGDMLAQFTEGVTGTNAATEQAAINMDTFAERMSRMKAEVQDKLIGAFQAIGPAIGKLLDIIVPALTNVFNNLSSALGPTVEVLAKVIGGVLAGVLIGLTKTLEFITGLFADLGPFILAAAGAYTVYAIATNAATIATKAAQLAQAAFNAIAAANPIGLIIAGLVAAAAAYKLIADAIVVTNAEQLEAAEASIKNLDAQKKQNLEQQKGVQGTQAMVAEFKKLATQATRTKEEEARLEEIQGKLDKQYPSLIDQTKTFKENLDGVDEIGKRATTELGKLSTAAQELDKTMAATSRTIAGLKRNVALDELDDSFGRVNLLGRASENQFRKELQGRVDAFKDELYKASNSDDVKAAQKKLLDFLNLEGSKLGDDTQLETIISKVIAASNAASDALDVWKGKAKEVADANDEITKKTPPPPPAPITKKDKDAAFAYFKTLRETEQKSLENEVRKNKSLADGTLSKEGQLEIDNKALAVAKLLKDKYAEIFGFNDKTSITKLNFKTEDGEDPKQVLADINKQFVEMTGTVITAELKVNKVGTIDILGDVKEQLKKINEAAKDNSKNFIDGMIDADQFMIAFDGFGKGLQLSIDALRKKTADPLIQADPKLLKQYEDTIAELEQRILALNKETGDALIKQDTEATKRRVAANKSEIEELLLNKEENREKILQFERENLALETDLKLRALTSNGELRERETAIIIREAARRRRAIEDEFGQPPSAVSGFALGLVDTIREAFKDLTAEQKKARDESLAALRKEEDDLKESLKNKEGSIAEFYAKQAELKKKAAEQTDGIPFLDVLKSGVLKQASTSLGQFVEAASVKFTKLANAGNATFGALAEIVGATFGAGLADAIAQGQSVLQSALQQMAKAATSALDLLIPVITAQFLGFLGVFGAPVAAIAIQGLKALLNNAVSSIGADQGVVGLTEAYRTRPSARDTIAVMMRRGESAIVPEATAKNRDILTWFNKTHGSWQDFATQQLSATDLRAMFERKTGKPIDMPTSVGRLDLNTNKQVVVLEANNRMLEKKMDRMTKEIRSLKGHIAKSIDITLKPEMDKDGLIKDMEIQQSWKLNRL